MQYKYAEIADTVYFWFAANDDTGTAADGATPLYDVRLAGAAADAAPTASGTPTLLTHANYSPGLFEIAIDTTGYAVGEYSVFCTLTISTVNPAGFCGSFKLRTAGTAALATNTVAWLGTAAHAASEAGTACVEVVRWGGNDIAATAVNGVPKVAVTHVNAAAQTATLDTIKAETVLILEDTGTTIPGTITTAQGNITSILEDTGTTLDTLIKDIPTNAELAAATIATVTDLTNAPTVGDFTDTMKTSLATAMLAAGGSGGTTWTYTLTDADTAAPIAGTTVWVTSDLAGTTVIASGVTNASGVATFSLTNGATVYVWRLKSGYNFTNPDTETVS